ncbi:MAG: MurR/RpiR family transcriptional regulator [Desulfobacteraceae bacterium]|jgi:RpiR family carbohydrate utilization transcriptional regulator
MSDTLSTIRAAMPRFRNSEKKVAECVLKDPDSVILSSITELAESSGTSEPTVIRFCRKLDLRGYLELKLNLAKDLPSSQYIHENVKEEDSVPEIFNKLFNSAKEAFNNTLNHLDLKVIEDAVEALRMAERVEFYGQGGSGVVARDAHHKFFRLGIPSIVYDDPHMQVMSAALLSPKDVVVAISHTGSTKDILESAKIAKSSGATVIGIVGQENVPLSRICDIVICIRSQEAALRLAPMTSRLIQLAIIDVLFVALAMRDFSKTRDRLDRVKRSLVDKRY